MNRIFPIASVIVLAAAYCPLTWAGQLECQQWQTAHPEWLWCDDFEDDATLSQSYFEVDRASGRFLVTNETAFGGNGSLMGTYIPGQAGAGNIKLSLGPDPVTAKSLGTGILQEVYWRFYMKVSSNWTGNAMKLTRAIVFAASDWSEAAVGHVWEDSTSSNGLGLDPVSGVVGDQVVTHGYNDFSNFTWLGKRNGTTQVYAPENRDRWFCIEAHMKLNTPGKSDGQFDLWIDGKSEVQIEGLNWRGSYTQYGINAIFLENYKNDSVSQSQSRYFDNFIVSRSRIGCLGDARPNAPIDLRAE